MLILHAAAILAVRCIQLNTNPLSCCEVGIAHEPNRSFSVFDQHPGSDPEARYDARHGCDPKQVLLLHHG
jgi:hypothetical protein